VGQTLSDRTVVHYNTAVADGRRPPREDPLSEGGSFFEDDGPRLVAVPINPRRRPRFDKFERNAVFGAIKKAGLDPGEFNLRAGGPREFTLTHASVAEFKVESLRLGIVRSSARWGEGHERERVSVSWKLGLSAWLRRVKRELETPDFWKLFETEQQLLDAPAVDASDNTPFTPDEQVEIREQLDEVRAYALNSGDFTDDELERLNSKLDVLVESARHSRRADWREQVLGALLAAVAGNALPPEATLHVLQMVVQGIGHLFGQPGLLPP
jgi:hypothetical protein